MTHSFRIDSMRWILELNDQAAHWIQVHNLDAAVYLLDLALSQVQHLAMNHSVGNKHALWNNPEAPFVPPQMTPPVDPVGMEPVPISCISNRGANPSTKCVEPKSDDSYVHQSPITSHQVLYDQTHHGSYSVGAGWNEQSISIMLIFNMALCHHLRAVDREYQARYGTDMRVIQLHKALRLYELCFAMQLHPSSGDDCHHESSRSSSMTAPTASLSSSSTHSKDENGDPRSPSRYLASRSSHDPAAWEASSATVSLPMVYVLALVNNCGQIHQQLHHPHQAHKFLQHMVTTLMAVLQLGELSVPTSSSTRVSTSSDSHHLTTTTLEEDTFRIQQRYIPMIRPDQLDGFLRNASRLILRDSGAASAA